MARYIDADKLLYNEITDKHGDTYLVVHTPEIDNAPTEDVQPVVHAEWKELDYGGFYECSKCGYMTDYKQTKYCAECGAKMDKE